MKNLSLFIVVISLIAGSLFSAMHAHAGNIAGGDVQIVKSMDEDSNDSDSSKQFVECHQCCSSISHVMFSQQSNYMSPSSLKKVFI